LQLQCSSNQGNLGSGANAQLLEDVANMHFDCSFADEERLGYLAVCHASAEQLAYFQLAL
jgi:hypothetical protein